MTSEPQLKYRTQNFLETGLLGNPKMMSIWEHIGELRSRLINCLVAIIVLFIVTMIFASDILRFLKQPLTDALPAGAPSLHYTNPIDVFFVTMKVAFLAALVGACPVWLYQLWKFIEPGLYPEERRYAFPFLTASIGLFVIGVTFCFEIMLPLALKFLLSYGADVATPMITVTDYVSLVTLLFLAFGFAFETPLILVLLAVLGVIDDKTLTENRKIIIIGILIFAAIVTPPDPISQIILAIPMYLLFEGAVIVIRYLAKRKQRFKEQEQKEQASEVTL